MVWPCEIPGHYHKSSFTSVQRSKIHVWLKTTKNTFLLFKPRCNCNFSFSLKRAEVQCRIITQRKDSLDSPPSPVERIRDAACCLVRVFRWSAADKTSTTGLEVKPYVRTPKCWLKMPCVAFPLSRSFCKHVLVCVHVRGSVWVCTCLCSPVYWSLFCYSILLHHI